MTLFRTLAICAAAASISTAATAATVTHLYQGETATGETLSGWFTIDDSAPIGSVYPNAVLNAEITGLSFTHSILGAVGLSGLAATDFTYFTGGTTGTVSGGSGNLTDGALYSITLYSSGYILAGGWFQGQWTSHMGEPPGEVPLPGSLLLLAASLLGLVAIAGCSAAPDGTLANGRSPAPRTRPKA